MRAFIAVEISNSEILKKIQTFQEELKIDGKPTRIDQMHFTLQFLGEIDDDECKLVKSVLKRIEFLQFELSLQGVGTFPNLRNPRVIWIGCDKSGAEKLSNIAKEIGNNLSSLNFKKDKEFKPHLTIFRIKKKLDDISSRVNEVNAHEFGTQIVSKIKLKRSILSPKGPEYSDLLEVNSNEK